jgi:hypothetical protein
MQPAFQPFAPQHVDDAPCARMAIPEHTVPRNANRGIAVL